MLSYSFDIPDYEDMSAVRQGVAVYRPFVSCMVNGEDIVSSDMTGGRSVQDNNMIRDSRLGIASNGTESPRIETK